MLLGLHSWVGEVIDFDDDVELSCGGLYEMGQFEDGKLFRDVIRDAALASGCRVATGDLDATHGVANVEETARLSSLAVNGERLSDGRLNTKAIQDGAKDIIVVEAIDQHLIERGFVGHRSVNDPLVQVGSAKTPDLASEHHVVAVVHFREVIEGARLLREWNYVLAAVVFDGDVALFDVNVGGAVLAHGAQLDEVTIRQKFANGEKNVQCSDDVVHLGEDGVLAVDHRVGSRALLGEMDHGFRFEGLECGSEKVVVGNVTDKQFDGLAGHVLPDPDAIRQRANRSQRLRTKLVVPKAPQKVVNDRNRMALLRQIEGRSPTAIAVPTEHGNLHVPSSGQISVQISAAIRSP